MISETAKAKINLTLQIRGRRPNGYHELVSLVAFAEVGDTIIYDPDASFAIDAAGPFAGAIEGENLISRACRLALEAQPDLRIGRIRLTKLLPVAAGLGGGSADAAAVLRALMRAGLALSSGRLEAIAAELGADVTVCLAQRSALMWGIGEKIIEIPHLPPFWLVLANPGVPLSTAPVFRALQASPLHGEPGPPDIPSPFVTLSGLVDWAHSRGNDLQGAAAALCPAITDVLTAIEATPGCLMAAQSGSGPTCFGMYARANEARVAAAAVADGRAGWWVAVSAVGSLSPA